MSEDRREAERTDVLQRLAEIDDLLAEHNEKLCAHDGPSGVSG